MFDATEMGRTWNRYMVASLRNVARRHSSVVAVVGLGHLSGIQKHWKEDINVSINWSSVSFSPIATTVSYSKDEVYNIHCFRSCSGGRTDDNTFCEYHQKQKVVLEQSSIRSWRNHCGRCFISAQIVSITWICRWGQLGTTRGVINKVTYTIASSLPSIVVRLNKWLFVNFFENLFLLLDRRS